MKDYKEINDKIAELAELAKKHNQPLMVFSEDRDAIIGRGKKLPTLILDTYRFAFQSGDNSEASLLAVACAAVVIAAFEDNVFDRAQFLDTLREIK